MAIHLCAHRENNVLIGTGNKQPPFILDNTNNVKIKIYNQIF